MVPRRPQGNHVYQEHPEPILELFGEGGEVMNTELRLRWLLLWPIVLLPFGSFAAVPTGAIEGRILSPATGKYVRSAQVRVDPTGESTLSTAGGHFSFSSLPAGEATLVVTFAGFPATRVPVHVPPGGRANVDVTLASGPDTPTVRLDPFVVSTEREGNAKALMEQRGSMNITNSIASDVFGDNAEGNVGEFLRNMPGVQLDTLYGEVRNVGLGGLGPEYTSVTMDGISLVGADANDASGTGINTRAVTFEMVSLSSMDAVEVSKTISADVDANAAGGTINMRTKRAFDRDGRRVSWQANLALHSADFTLHPTRGPYDRGRRYKARPGGILEYSDVFLGKRLGIIFNLSESNIYQAVQYTTANYNRTPTAADPRPQVLTSLAFQHAPRFNKRFATTLTADFKATRELVLSLGLIYNYVDLWTPQRTVTFNHGARNTILGDEGFTWLETTSSATNVVVNPVATAKMGETFTVLPKFEYKRGDLLVEGRFAYGDSASWYDPFGRRSTVRDASSPSLNGIRIRAVRSSPSSVDWTLTQTGGPDFASGAGFTNPAVAINDGRFSRAVLMTGELAGSYKTRRVLPVIWKAGAKTRYESRKFEDDRAMKRYDYRGEGNGTTGAWAGFRSPYDFDLGMSGSRLLSLSGRNVFIPDLTRIADVYTENPGAFAYTVTPTNYYDSYVARRRRYDETVDAAFLMATATRGKSTFRAGLRWEDTHTDATEPNARSTAEMKAAGYAVNSSGVATTFDGIDYQFLSRPRIHRRGSYDNFFPSGSFKYRLDTNLDLHLGFSSTIRRPAYASVAGVRIINDDALRVTTPNVNLRPETARNYAARLAYYFESVGLISVSCFQNSVKALHVTEELTAEQFGYHGDEDLSSYTFVTTTNSAERVRVRGLELEYSQSLGFLGAAFRRLTVRASYTRSYASLIKTGLVPHSVNGGFNYILGRLNVYANANWLDDYPVSATGLTYRRHRLTMDGGTSWRISDRVSIGLSARNLLDAPFVTMQWVAPSPPTVYQHLSTGATYTLAVKGTF
jgi:TonB-dependent receptor